MNNQEETMRKQLSDLKVGDLVIHKNCLGSTTQSLEPIHRLTKTQVILSRDRRFRIKDGELVGGRNRWDRYWIEPTTPELIAEVERINKIKQAKYDCNHLIRQIEKICYKGEAVAVVIPHLKAALAALKGDCTPEEES